MSEDNLRGNRREILKASGNVMVGFSTLGILGQGALASDTWDCDSGCPEIEPVTTEVIDLDNPDREGGLSVHWFGSGYYSDEWEHELAISGAASGKWEGIQGQTYGVEAEPFTGSVDPKTRNDWFGHYPSGDSGIIPDWAQPLLEESIGTLSTGAGWFLAVNESLKEALSNHDDGFDLGEYQNGFSYRDTNEVHETWTQCCFFHRFDYEISDWGAGLTFHGGFSDEQGPYSTSFEEIEINVGIWGDSGPVPVSSELESKSPADLTQERREELGIIKVPEKADPATFTGDAVPEYIATKSPVSVKNVEQTTRHIAHDGIEVDENGRPLTDT